MPSPLKPKEVLRTAQEAERTGNIKKASQNYAILASFLRKQKKYSDAQKMISKALSLSPNSARLYILRSRIYAESGNLEEARKYISQFTELAWEKKRLSDYQDYFDEQLANEPVLRKFHYETLLQWDRTNTAYFTELARAHMELGEEEDAKRLLMAAIKDKNHVDAILPILKELFNKMEQPEFIALVEKVEGNELAVSDFINLVFKGDSVAGAESNMSPRSLETKPDREEQDLKSLISELEKELGMEAESELENVKPLIQEFRRRADPIILEDSKSRIDLAFAFFEMGLYRDSLSELARVTSTDSLSAEARALEGEVYAAEGMDLSALERFQDCLRMDHISTDQRKDFMYRTIEIYMRLGDVSQALVVAAKLAKIDPDYRRLHQLTLTLKERANR